MVPFLSARSRIATTSEPASGSLSPRPDMLARNQFRQVFALLRLAAGAAESG